MLRRKSRLLKLSFISFGCKNSTRSVLLCSLGAAGAVARVAARDQAGLRTVEVVRGPVEVVQGPAEVARDPAELRSRQSEGSENTKKRRNHTGAGVVVEAGDPSRESGELPLNPSYSIRPTDVQDEPRPPPHGVHPDDWEVASSFSELDDGTRGPGGRGIGDCVQPGDESDLDDDGFGESSLGCTLCVRVAHHWGLREQNAIFALCSIASDMEKMHFQQARRVQHLLDS
jgi:hypothetical protein